METAERTNKIMMTIKEASQVTGLSYACIRRLCLENEIRYIRSGAKYYVNTASLLQYCEKGC